MNHDLERTLPLASQLEDVFAAIRPSYDRPELWEDTKEIRSELDGLHKALSFVNCNVAKNGLQAIPFAVKVEEDFEELRSRAEDSGIISSLPLTREPMLICLMPRPDGLHTENDFILSTPVTVAKESRITNLPQRIAALKENNQDFDVIGNIEHSARETWIYHFQRVEDVDLIDGHHVSALVEDARLRQKERICLAAGIARSYLHYMEINPGKCHGPLNNYRLFVQESPVTGSRDWALWPSSSLWVEFGFGSSTASKTNKFLSKAQYQEKKISPAVELGVLLYQVTAAESLTYNPTAEGLQIARQTAQDGLSKVEQLCGLFMRDVVAACLMDLGNRWEDRDVVEEVASALIYRAAGLRKAKPSL
ncbi:hypothetical protein J7337_013791 [Fusarium musae]|uniref:Uncharacterized protein n=1 Tax=Fusarium musae TaxID=1042133 RepID=A0A9P8D559_9HYPO|nr:hypothetical protein J7337_013791 [Fusarium musae]KAG9495542.1 hypothetical protein J7337_013791 [Fusarium musae]